MKTMSYWIHALARRAAHHLLAPWCVERTYGQPAPHGWRGWIEAPNGHTIAFRTSEGQLSYRW